MQALLMESILYYPTFLLGFNVYESELLQVFHGGFQKSCNRKVPDRGRIQVKYVHHSIITNFHVKITHVL